MPRKPLVAAEASTWATLAYVAKLHLKRADIKPGAYRQDLRVTGTSAGYPIDLPIHGDGTQSGPQTTASTTGPSREQWVEYFCRFVPTTVLARIKVEAIAYFAEHGELPGSTPQGLEEATLLCKQTRATSPSTKSGAYTFAADPDPDDVAAAAARAA